MTTAIDTNVLSELLGSGPTADRCAHALGEAAHRGGLVICSIVFAELIAATRDTTPLAAVLSEMDIRVDEGFSVQSDTLAGGAWREYTARRRQAGSLYHCPSCGKANAAFSCTACSQPITGGPRHVLADFLIGAHALSVGASLLTAGRRGGIYGTYFPSLKILHP